MGPRETLTASRRRQTRSRCLGPSVHLIVFFSSSSCPSLVVPLYTIFNVPQRPPVKNMLRKTRRFGCGLRSYVAREVCFPGSSTNSPPILSLRLPVRLPHKSSECRVLLYHWEDHRAPEQVRFWPRVLHHEHANAISRESGHAFSRTRCVLPLFFFPSTCRN